MVVVKCDTCGNDVRKHHTRVSTHNFCNRECYLKFHAAFREMKTCQFCGKEFRPANSNNANKFCSRECYHESHYHSEVTSGKKHWQWKGGVSKGERHTPEYANFRMEILKRDDFTCKYCNRRGVKLEAHHILSWKHYPELRTDPSNILTVCVECHDKIHNIFGYNSLEKMVL